MHVNGRAIPRSYSQPSTNNNIHSIQRQDTITVTCFYTIEQMFACSTFVNTRYNDTKISMLFLDNNNNNITSKWVLPIVIVVALLLLCIFCKMVRLIQSRCFTAHMDANANIHLRWWWRWIFPIRLSLCVFFVVKCHFVHTKLMNDSNSTFPTSVRYW